MHVQQESVGSAALWNPSLNWRQVTSFYTIRPDYKQVTFPLKACYENLVKKEWSLKMKLITTDFLIWAILKLCLPSLLPVTFSAQIFKHSQSSAAPLDTTCTGCSGRFEHIWWCNSSQQIHNYLFICSLHFVLDKMTSSFLPE